MAAKRQEIIDISVALDQDTVTYPGDPPFSWQQLASLAQGDSANLSGLALGSHSGTHVDVPAHFCKDGLTLDQIPLEHWLGPALVLDATGADECVRAKDLAGAPLKDYQRILIKTKNCLAQARQFQYDFIYLAQDACELLVAAGVKTVGWDYLSIDPPGSSFPAHLTLLGQGVCIIENINLGDVQPGPYYLACLPLKIQRTEAAPARALLFRGNPCRQG